MSKVNTAKKLTYLMSRIQSDDRVKLAQQYCKKHSQSYISFCNECQLEADTASTCKDRLEALLTHSALKARDKINSLDSYQPTCLNAQKALNTCICFVEKYQELKKSGASMIFCGNTGCGKNHLATGIMLSLMNKYYASTRFTTAKNMIAEINVTYTNTLSHENEIDVRERYSKYDLLVIDEIDLVRGSKNDQLQLFEIINERYRDLKNTIVISNLKEQELFNVLGQRIMSRLSENGKIINFDWEDYRTRTISLNPNVDLSSVA